MRLTVVCLAFASLVALPAQAKSPAPKLSFGQRMAVRLAPQPPGCQPFPPHPRMRHSPCPA